EASRAIKPAIQRTGTPIQGPIPFRKSEITRREGQDMTSDYAFMGAVELGKKIARGAVTSVEATRAMLERIERLNGSLRCYELVMADQALSDAKKADREIKAKKVRGPLHGVPVAIKDLCDIEGVPTASGIPMFRSTVAKRTATVAARLKAAGAVNLG